MIIGTIRDIKDTAKDLLENRTKKRDFENFINKLFFEIENDLVDNFFYKNYQELDKLSLKIDLNKLDEAYIKKYKRIKEYYKENYNRTAFNFTLY